MVINPSIVFRGFLGGDEPGWGSNGEPLEDSPVLAGTGDVVRERVGEELAGVDDADVTGWGVVVAGMEVIEEETEDDDDNGSINTDDEYDHLVLVDHTKPADELNATKEYASVVTLGASTLAGAPPSTPNASFHASAACCPA